MQEKPIVTLKVKDLLPDDKYSVNINGQEVRKGSIGSFMMNCQTIAQANKESEGYKAAMTDVKAQAILLKAIGFFEIFHLKDPELKKIME